MSLKLFLLNTFGGIKSTSKIESEKESLLRDYQVFKQVEGSEELNEFLELEKKVKSESFRRLRVELKNLKFKGSPEERQLKQFEKLRRNRKLRRFYQTKNSEELKRYKELKEGDKLTRYFELDKLMKQGVSDEKSKAVKTEYSKLKSSEDVRFFQKYPKSSAYKNYLRMKGAEERKNYETLKDIIEREDFKNHRAYLEDPRKWEKTEEYRDEQRYEELKNKPEIAIYLKYKDSNALDFFKNWNLVFEDRFEYGILDQTKWKTINYWAEKTVGKNFSREGDLQAFNHGKNVHLKDSCLKLQVKKDKVNSLVWSPAVGFIEKEFNYSSDMLTTGGLFQATYGLLEAKIKYDPSRNFQDIFYLAGEDNDLRVNLIESGVKNQFGLTQMNGGKAHERTFSLSGLSKSKFYIFSLEWQQGKLSWKLNDRELFTLNSNVPDTPMFINLATLIINETTQLPHDFQIDWIRMYQRKS